MNLGGEEKADNAEQKGPKADQAAGRLLLCFTLVEFTSRGSDLLVGLYFLLLTANMMMFRALWCGCAVWPC